TGTANLLNSVTGYQFNGTSGSTTTCSSGDVLQNAVIQGGIITAGTCIANGGGSSYVTLQATTPGTADTGNFNISGTGIANLLQAANLDTASAGTLGIGNTNATTINIGTNAAAHTIAIGNGAAAQAVTIGSINGASALVLQSGSVGTTLNTNSSYTFNIQGTQVFYADFGTFEFRPLNDASDAFVVKNRSSGASVLRVNTLTNLVTATNMTVTGNLNVDVIDIASGSTLSIGNTSASTINIGTNAAAHTIAIGTGAAVQGITIGSGNSTSSLALQTGSGGFSLNTSGTSTFTSDSTGRIVIKPTTNNAGIFRVQDSGGVDLLQVDSGTDLITIAAPINSSRYIQTSSYLNLTVGSTTSFITPVGSTVPTKINIVYYDPGNAGQVLALGIPSTTANANSRVISVFDARTGAHQPSIALFSPNEANVIGLNWDGSNTTPAVSTTTTGINFNVNGSTTVLGINQSGTNAIAQLGSAASSTGQLLLASSSSGSIITLQAGSTAANYTTVLPTNVGSTGQCLYVASLVGAVQSLDYKTCATTTGAGYVTLQGSTPGTADTGNINISGTAIADILQGTTKVLTPLLDTISSGVLNVGTTNATQINLNKNVVVAAAQYITLVGGITSTRPVTPADGTLYYDQTTKTLLVYANSRWQSYGGNAATKIVAMGTATGCSGSSPVASGSPDGADFISTSCTSSQTTIASAITALPAGGGTVYLMEGTYIIDGTIALPNNVRLTGSGRNTIIKLKDGINAGIDAISDTATTNVEISNLRLDGNKANNSSGTQRGINMNGVGSGTGTSGVPGAHISNVFIKDFRTNGAYLNGSPNSVITGSVFENIGTTTSDYAIGLLATGYITVTSNLIQGSVGYGINASSDSNTITGNTIEGSGNYAIGAGGSYITISGNTLRGNVHGIDAGNDGLITGNVIVGNTTRGIYISGAGMTVTGNNIVANAIGIYAVNGSRSTVTGNTITQNTTNGISWLGGSSNVISGNKFYDNAGSGSGSTIDLSGTATDITISSNSITDTAGTGSAIKLASNSLNIYLSGNTYSGTGATSINDASGTTIYANQVDSNGNLINRNQGGLTVGKTSASYTLDVQGSMRTTALPTPAAPTLVKVGATGALTWGYKVSALDGFGETLASTETTLSNGVSPLTGSNYITINWVPIGGAVQYKVFRTTSGGTPATTGLIGTVAGNVQTFNDTGIAASGAVAASNTTGAGVFAGALQGGSLDNSAAASLSIGATNATAITLGKTSSNIQTTINGTALFKPTSGNDSTTAVQIQKADSTVLFTADTSGMQIIIGTAGNTITLSSNGIVLAGNARNSKKIVLAAEYVGAVLDASGSNNSGTMTSGIDATPRMNFYRWTTTQTGTAQTYDVVVQVPIPSDFDSWNSNPLTISTYTTNTTNGTATMEVRDSGNTQICNFVAINPGSTLTWVANNTACTLSSGTYTPGDYLTIRVRLSSISNANIQVGNIVLNYKSKF
ncbi:MAG: right-handed parallel beta-helix repeat-containing protein, partial [Candidatus Saccharimonadales bacterium]